MWVRLVYYPHHTPMVSIGHVHLRLINGNAPKCIHCTNKGTRGGSQGLQWRSPQCSAQCSTLLHTPSCAHKCTKSPCQMVARHICHMNNTRDHFEVQTKGFTSVCDLTVCVCGPFSALSSPDQRFTCNKGHFRTLHTHIDQGARVMCARLT